MACVLFKIWKQSELVARIASTNKQNLSITFSLMGMAYRFFQHPLRVETLKSKMYVSTAVMRLDLFYCSKRKMVVLSTLIVWFGHRKNDRCIVVSILVMPHCKTAQVGIRAGIAISVHFYSVFSLCTQVVSKHEMKIRFTSLQPILAFFLSL